MHAELRDALAAAEADAAVRCLVITGDGRAFSSGQDLTEERLAGPDGKIDFGGRLDRDYNPLAGGIYTYPKVTIAALNGPAVGAAANLALACDLIVAARSAYLQEAFARIALVPDAGGTWFLPRIVGPKLALALMLTADQVRSRRSSPHGASSTRSFADAEFMGETMTLARRRSPPARPQTFRLIKEAGAGQRRERPEDPARSRARSAARRRREPRLRRRHRGIPRKRAPKFSGH